MNATTCRRTASSRSSVVRRLDSSSACPRRSRGRTVIIRSSSCSADLCGIASTPKRRRRRGRSNTRSLFARPRFSPASTTGADKRFEFQALYQLLVDDETRNRAICEEVVQAVRDGRSPLMLTERNEHLDRFESQLSDKRSSRRGPARRNGEEAAPGARPSDWQPSHRKKVASFWRLASTSERDSTIRDWTRCF